MNVRVIANFDIAYERGGTKFWTEDIVSIVVSRDMPYFDVVALLDEVIKGKYGSEAILGDVTVKRYAMAAKGEGL